jgi:hypothetical protein
MNDSLSHSVYSQSAALRLVKLRHLIRGHHSWERPYLLFHFNSSSAYFAYLFMRSYFQLFYKCIHFIFTAFILTSLSAHSAYTPCLLLITFACSVGHAVKVLTIYALCTYLSTCRALTAAQLIDADLAN